MTTGIYKIINVENGKFYIGSSINIEQRWNKHISQLRRNNHPNKHLQNSWNKYGENSFNFIILENVSEEQLLDVEQRWLDETFCYDTETGYNKSLVAGSPMKNRKHTKETIEKLRINSKGRKHTEAAKQKISDANKGRVFSPETRKKMSEAKKGIAPACAHTPMSEEGKRKLSQLAKKRTGYKNPNSKLTEKQICDLREDFRQNNKTIKELSVKYSVSISTIKRIKYNKTGY